MFARTSVATNCMDDEWDGGEDDGALVKRFKQVHGYHGRFYLGCDPLKSSVALKEERAQHRTDIQQMRTPLNSQFGSALVAMRALSQVWLL